MKRLIVPLLLLSQGWLCADSKPFQGKVHKIPGKVEAEHYDEGPPGVAYQDTDEANQGADYREATQVDIEKRSDASNGHGIGWTRKGEWLHYTVEVEKGGTYTLEMPVASQKKRGAICSPSGRPAHLQAHTGAGHRWVDSAPENPVQGCSSKKGPAGHPGGDAGTRAFGKHW